MHHFVATVMQKPAHWLFSITSASKRFQEDEAAEKISSAKLFRNSCCKRQVIKASTHLCISLFFQPFDGQGLSVGGSRWKDGLSIWRWFPRQRQRAKHSITVIDGDTKSHGHNHTPSASGKYQPGGVFQSSAVSHTPSLLCRSVLKYSVLPSTDTEEDWCTPRFTTYWQR